ncbi:MAG: hydroxymethylbilane synthase [Nitrospirae bacterium]|nr:hydroxymethylbilane synthase [Nitrospirota bacterium]
MSDRNKIVIGTRGSMLALWQAEYVQRTLMTHCPGVEVTLTKIKTTGDMILDVPLAQVGGKGLFVKEIEEAMLRGEIDLAVHSMKDVPTVLPDPLHLRSMPKREDPKDAFLSAKYAKFADLPQGATVGSSSLRRQCQLMAVRPDIKVESLRGNLDTRIRKMEEGLFDAVILAAAGIRRLGWGEKIKEYIDADVCLPAIGQGAIGIECRKDDEFINRVLIEALQHQDTWDCVVAERAFLKRLEGGCQVPIAAYATIIREGGGERLRLAGLVGSITGDRIIRDSMEVAVADGEKAGVELAEKLLGLGAAEILKEVYGKDVTGY